MERNILSTPVKLSFFMIFIFVLTFNAVIAHSAEVKLAWDPNPAPQPDGYKLYYGLESGIILNKGPGNLNLFVVVE